MLNNDHNLVNEPLILGLACEGGKGDIRETPATRIVELLPARGSQVSVRGPQTFDVSGIRPPDVKFEKLDGIESAGARQASQR